MNRVQKKTVLSVVYYVGGTMLAVLFLFPLVYMLATSTKTESLYASDVGTLAMFLPNFQSLSTAFENYKTIFSTYGVWRYAVNSLVYAVVVIVLNVLINGLAAYVMAKFDFPGKGFFNFIIMFLIVVPVETSIIPLYSIVKVLLGLKQTASVLAIILPSSISIFNIYSTKFFSIFHYYYC